MDKGLLGLYLDSMNNEAFLQILDAIDDMVLVKGPKSRLLWANAAFRKYYGMSNEELSGIIDAPFSEPDYTQQFVRDDRYVFETGKTIHIPQELVNRHDGVTRIFNTVKSPIFDEEGKVVMSVGISRDITDRLEAEGILREERARAVHASKMASLGEMAGGVAHEVNTPLTAIALLASQSLSILKAPSPDLEKARQSIRDIGKTTEHISRIIAGLRSISRDGRNDPFVMAKINSIIEDTLAISKERFLGQAIDVRISLSPENPVVRCRPSEIAQVLVNLLNNAHDAITASSGPRWIHVASQVIDDAVEFSVADSGGAIHPSNRDKLFTPFFTTKAMGKGTGLGLSISKSIVDAHAGAIAFDGASMYTRFVVRLPRG